MTNINNPIHVVYILLNCLQTLEYLLCHTAIHHTKLVINCLWQCKTLFRVLHMQHYCKATNCKFIVASMPKLPEHRAGANGQAGQVLA